MRWQENKAKKNDFIANFGVSPLNYATDGCVLVEYFCVFLTDFQSEVWIIVDELFKNDHLLKRRVPCPKYKVIKFYVPNVPNVPFYFFHTITTLLSTLGTKGTKGTYF